MLAPSSPACSRIAELMHFVRLFSIKTVNDWPAERLTFQRGPEDNHPLWVMGHIAGTDAWIGGLLKIPGTEVPESFQKLFGQGTKPVSDASIYPSLGEVRGYFDGARTAIRHWLDNADDAALATPLKDVTGGFASDAQDALHKLMWHEGWHIGQVATLRKALGLPNVF